MMEKLYIKVDQDGVFIDHPHLEENLLQLYPSHNFKEGPPDGWMEFVRVPPPNLDVYEKFDDTKGGNIALAFPHNGLEYKIVDGKYTDVWHVLEMTAEEKIEKQEEVKAQWAVYPNWNSWTFDEETCSFVPPVAKPDDGNSYRWDEATTSWVAV